MPLRPFSHYLMPKTPGNRGGTPGGRQGPPGAGPLGRQGTPGGRQGDAGGRASGTPGDARGTPGGRRGTPGDAGGRRGLGTPGPGHFSGIATWVWLMYGVPASPDLSRPSRSGASSSPAATAVNSLILTCRSAGTSATTVLDPCFCLSPKRGKPAVTSRKITARSCCWPAWRPWWCSSPSRSSPTASWSETGTTPVSPVD